MVGDGLDVNGPRMQPTAGPVEQKGVSLQQLVKNANALRKTVMGEDISIKQVLPDAKKIITFLANFFGKNNLQNLADNPDIKNACKASVLLKMSEGLNKNASKGLSEAVKTAAPPEAEKKAVSHSSRSLEEFKLTDEENNDECTRIAADKFIADCEKFETSTNVADLHSQIAKVTHYLDYTYGVKGLETIPNLPIDSDINKLQNKLNKLLDAYDKQINPETPSKPVSTPETAAVEERGVNTLPETIQEEQSQEKQVVPEQTGGITPKSEPHRSSMSKAIDITLNSVNRLRSRSVSDTKKTEAKEETTPQTPKEKIDDQLKELQNLLPELGKSNARLEIKNGKLSVRVPSMLDSISSKKSPAIVLDQLREMTSNVVLLDTENKNTELSKNLLSQLNEIKNTDWGSNNLEVLNELTNQLGEKITQHDNEMTAQFLSKIKAPLLENPEEVKELAQPEQMKKTIKKEQMPLLLTGAANPEFVRSFQKNAAYLMDPDEMGESFKSALDLVNNQTDPEVKKTMMDNLVVSCMVISEVYRENKLVTEGNITEWRSILPDSIKTPMTDVANAANETNLSDKLKPKSIQDPKEMQHLPQLGDIDEKKLKDNTSEMLSQVRSGKIKGEYIKNVTSELRFVQSYYLGSIQPNEFRNQAWSKPATADNASHISGFLEASNCLTRQILDDILVSKSNTPPTEGVEKKNLKEALNTMEFYSEVMNSCIEDGNFAAAFSIHVGLESFYLSRMVDRAVDKGYDGPSEKYTANINKAKELFNAEKSYKAFRTELENSKKPCLIPLGMYLTDYTFIDDGNKNQIDKQLNSEKLKMEGDLFEKLDENKPEVPNNFSQLQTRLFDPQFNLRSTGTGYKGITEEELAARVNSTVSK